jgi:hypothetical protein
MSSDALVKEDTLRRGVAEEPTGTMAVKPRGFAETSEILKRIVDGRKTCGMLAGLSDGSYRQVCEQTSVDGGGLVLLRASPWSHVQQVIAHAMLEFSSL